MVDKLASSSLPQASNRSNGTASKAFQPRTGVQRKTKAERDQYAQQEAERQQERLGARDKVGETSRSTTAGDNVGRGRGNAASNRGGRGRINKPGVGVFGSGSPSRSGAKSKGHLDSGDVEGEPVDGRIPVEQDDSATKESVTSAPKKTEKQSVATSKNEGSKAAKKPSASHAISSSEESDEPGRDIEMIWVSSDEDDQEVLSQKGKQKQSLQTQKSGTGLRPIRAPKTTIEDDEDTRLPRPRPSRVNTKKSGESEVHDIDMDEMTIDEPETLREPPLNPEQRKKSTKKPSGRMRDTKAAETAEERSERRRLDDDIQKMREEFLASTPTNDAAYEPDRSPTRKFILFQFPPITPFLIDRQAQTTPTDIKTEPNSDGSSAVKRAWTAPQPSTGMTPETKHDPEAPHSSIPPGGTLTASSTQLLPQGQVGKLKIHKSGKVTLDWGGTNMEVRYGTEVDFLQDAVFLDASAAVGEPGNENDNHNDDGQESEKPKKQATAYALGQVQKKMVVIPDWSRLYD